jgi:hypothetical protein
VIIGSVGHFLPKTANEPGELIWEEFLLVFHGIHWYAASTGEWPEAGLLVQFINGLPTDGTYFCYNTGKIS